EPREAELGRRGRRGRRGARARRDRAHGGRGRWPERRRRRDRGALLVLEGVGLVVDGAGELEAHPAELVLEAALGARELGRAGGGALRAEHLLTLEVFDDGLDERVEGLEHALARRGRGGED